MFGWLKKKSENKNDTLLLGAEVIAEEFGAFVEHDDDPISIRDEVTLPRGKSAIIMSLRLVFEAAGDDEAKRAALVICALHLANFQKGVGKVPLSPPGAGALRLDIGSATNEELLSAVIGKPEEADRYNQFALLVQAERQSIKQFFEI